MKKSEEAKLKKLLDLYFKELHQIYVSEKFREESFYPSLKSLIEGCSNLLGESSRVLVSPKETDVGIPDFLIQRDGEPIGYIEAKSPDTDLEKIENSEQLKRYRASLPNLILTNFLEFRLYKNSNPIDKIEVGRQSTLQTLKYPPIPEKLDLFLELLTKFFSFSTPKIKSSSELSKELAKRTRFLEHILQEELSRENEQVTMFYHAFQQELIETLTKERFADLYAQTITYGLFAARMRAQNKFNKELAWQSIPENLPLLKNIFYSFTGPHFPQSLRWVVDEISHVLDKADIASIYGEFKTTKWEEDPVIQFYETFLATYNPNERQRLGVYYTPPPVVSYITTSIHKLLKDKFGKTEGLATNDVTLLDPAAGTLTFVVQAIKLVQKELEITNKPGLLKSCIEKHILPNLHAFEILVAPYTVGHFKVSMVLEEMGYKFKNGERFKFYLTNTLEMKEPKQISFLIDLAKEGQEAKKIKEKVPILVVLGNPPYSVSSENKSEFIERLMDSYKEDVRDERNIQPLSDDYIKFIRFAHWKIDQAGKGIVGFITNNSYLSGVIHRGMRQKLLETFDEIYILNLHGSSRIGESPPEGGKDENVFAIQQGVAIALYVKLEEPQKKTKVYYADLWGLRSQKYEYLLANDKETTKWRKLKTAAPYYFFVPKDFALQAEYNNFWKITETFTRNKMGVITKRDNFIIDQNPQSLKGRILTLANSQTRDEEINLLYGLKDTYEWKLHPARERVIREGFKEENLINYAYRPFDTRYIYFEDCLIARSVREIMNHLLKDNLALVLPRNLQKDEYCNHAFVTTQVVDLHLLSILDAIYVFPLYFYPEQPEGQLFTMAEAERTPNFTDKFLQAIKESLGAEPTPEDIFYYIYAVLYSPAYRQRYQEFLKIDFPRIPLPTDNKVFEALSNLGKELVELHLLKHPCLSETEIGFPQVGSDTVEKVHYDEEAQRVYINKDQYFAGISKEVWDYRIGAYQVMEKYLKDRKGRKLSPDEINHYMKMAKAIRLTIELQKKIDAELLLTAT